MKTVGYSGMDSKRMGTLWERRQGLRGGSICVLRTKQCHRRAQTRGTMIKVRTGWERVVEDSVSFGSVLVGNGSLNVEN